MAKILEKKEFLIDDGITDHDDYCCMICLDIILVPVRCQGCKSTYCAGCASKWKADTNMCPKKCSQTWTFTPCQPFPIAFRCPHSDRCPPIGPLDFLAHAASCHESPSELKAAYYHKLNYECSKGHKLQFWQAPFAELKSGKCNQCDEIMCRSICRHCNQRYCVTCREPLCTKDRCPLGHEMFHVTDYGAGFLCDMCGVVPEVFGYVGGIWEDPKCNFGICDSCHSKIKTAPS